MRKFLLYFLLAIFLIAVGLFVFGFVNAKNLRSFAMNVSQIRASHDLEPQIELIEQSFRDNGRKDVFQIRDESKQFTQKLDDISRESQAAKKEIENLNTPLLASEASNLTQEYYAKIGSEADDLKGIIGYMSQIIDVAAIFGEIGEGTTLDDMKIIIARAKEKVDAVNTDELPADLKTSAQSLKESMGAFLVKMEDTATLKTQNSADLDASYADFSEKEDDFFAAAKNYIDKMENLSIIEERINSELVKLRGIKYSLK